MLIRNLLPFLASSHGPGVSSPYTSRQGDACALEQFEDLLTDLEVGPARNSAWQQRSLRPPQHITAILQRCYSQADTELQVRPDICVDRPGRFLRRQDQVHPQAAPLLYHAYQ